MYWNPLSIQLCSLIILLPIKHVLKPHSPWEKWGIHCCLITMEHWKTFPVIFMSSILFITNNQHCSLTRSLGRFQKIFHTFFIDFYFRLSFFSSQHQWGLILNSVEVLWTKAEAICYISIHYFIQYLYKYLYIRLNHTPQKLWIYCR